MENVTRNLLANHKVDPSDFDLTMGALLIGIGAEKYADIFRKSKIGQCTLMELTEQDLMILGVDDPKIRKKLLQEVTKLPIYEEYCNKLKEEYSELGMMEIVDIMEESCQHTYRIYLSMLANALALKKTKNNPDCLLYKDKYASDVALSTLSQMNNILNSMDLAIHTKLKVESKDVMKRKNKKIIVGTVGSAVAIVIAVLFVRSLKQLN